jgi:hypothetical protein
VTGAALDLDRAPTTVGTGPAVLGLPLVMGAARLFALAPTTLGVGLCCDGVAERGTRILVPERDREEAAVLGLAVGLAWALREL